MKLQKLLLRYAALLSVVLLVGCGKKKVKTVPSASIPSKDFFSSAKAGTKKILIISSSGGGGHTMAAQAITSYLEDDYSLATVNIFKEVLFPLDTLSVMTGQSFTGEDLYNFFLQRGSAVFANTMCGYGLGMIRRSTAQVERLLEQFLIQQKPDAVISVMPVINGALQRVTQKLNIPCSVIALDYDFERIGFTNGLKKVRDDKFFFGVPFNDITLHEKAVRAGIKPSQIRVIGCPLRTDFLKKKNQYNARLELGLPLDKPILMMLMGATGSRAVYRYALRLHEIKHPLHVIMCCGRGESLRQQILAMKFPENITVTVLGFTTKIADYMAASDLLLTKPGALSFNEALKMRIPMLFDKTHRVLCWETATIDFVKSHEFGTDIKQMKFFSKIVTSYIEHPEKLQYLRQKIAMYELPDVEHTVKMLVREMLSK